MGGEPGRRFLKQPAAKLEPVIIVVGNNSSCTLSKTFLLQQVAYTID